MSEITVKLYCHVSWWVKPLGFVLALPVRLFGYSYSEKAGDRIVKFVGTHGLHVRVAR